MAVKDALLARLEAARGACLSGGALARELSVSRNAVWKAAEALKREGFTVVSTPGKGYCLREDSNRLSAQGVRVHLQNRDFYRLTVERAVDSTNLRAKALAAQGAPEGTAVLAESQTAGRGRLGRAFFSPEGDGLYMSILLRPRIPADRALGLTTAAAVAVCEALEQTCGKRPGIKWVNDVLLEGKKVCGILTEAQMNVENGELDYAVVGIGINVQPPQGGFPADIARVAGALYDRGQAPPGLFCRLAASVLDRFYARAVVGLGEHLSAYRARSAVLGREVEVLLPDGARRARALAIQDDFGLRVAFEDGSEKVLSSGEVSTRLTKEETV